MDVIISGERSCTLKCASLETTIQNLQEMVRETLNEDMSPTLFLGSKPLRSENTLSIYLPSNVDTIHLTCQYFGLVGGKGGFGSLLRGQKSSKQTTNKGAMRDLSGRRLRHVEDEQRLQQWVKDEQKRKEEEEKKKEEEQIKRMEEKREQLAKTSKKLDKVADVVSNAVQKGLAKNGGRVFGATSEKELNMETNSDHKKKREREDGEPKANKKKRKNLFATEFDDLSSADDDSDEKGKQRAKQDE